MTWHLSWYLACYPQYNVCQVHPCCSVARIPFHARAERCLTVCTSVWSATDTCPWKSSNLKSTMMPGGGQCWRGSSLASGLGRGCACTCVCARTQVCVHARECACVRARACAHSRAGSVKDGESWSPHSNPVSRPQRYSLSCLTLGRQGTEGLQGRGEAVVGGQQGFSEPQGPGSTSPERSRCWDSQRPSA